MRAAPNRLVAQNEDDYEDGERDGDARLEALTRHPRPLSSFRERELPPPPAEDYDKTDRPKCIHRSSP